MADYYRVISDRLEMRMNGKWVGDLLTATHAYHDGLSWHIVSARGYLFGGPLGGAGSALGDAGITLNITSLELITYDQYQAESSSLNSVRQTSFEERKTNFDRCHTLALRQIEL